MAVPADTLAESDGPLLEVVTQGPLSVNSKVFSAIALFALDQRLPAEPRDGVAADVRHGQRGRRARASSARVHAGRRTPWVAIIFTASIAAVLVILGDLTTLADTTVLLLLLVFIGVHVSLLVLRKTPVDHEHFRRLDRRCRGSAPSTCAGLAVQSVVDDPEARAVGRRADRSSA